MCFWPGDYGAKYCSVADTELYFEINKPWRGFSAFAAFNSAQYDSLGKLAAWLCVTENINPVIFSTEGDYNPEPLPKFNGIFTHVNCRTDKRDLDPAFNWDYFNTLLTTAYEYYKERQSEYESPFI